VELEYENKRGDSFREPSLEVRLCVTVPQNEYASQVTAPGRLVQSQTTAEINDSIESNVAALLHFACGFSLLDVALANLTRQYSSLQGQTGTVLSVGCGLLDPKSCLGKSPEP
jgi:hypothetical protein